MPQRTEKPDPAPGQTVPGQSGTPPSTPPAAKPPTPYRGGAYRSNRRRTHHDDAHASETQAAGTTAPEASHDNHHPHHANPHIHRGPPELIETQPALLALLARLRTAGSFSYDSEFIGEATFTPKLCLVQIATTTEVALVDPLAPIDLTPFWQLLCDESVEKIVHAGQQDVEPVVRLTGDRPRNVFDTQIAAGFVGLTYPVALSKLASELLGAKLGKSMTFTQWDARPLSNTQLKYAADDVRFLPALRHELHARLEKAGHVARARDEFEALCEPTQYIFDPNTYIYRVRGNGSLTTTQLRILRELVIWRDGAARAADVPARAYLKDEILIDLARTPAKTHERLGKVKGLPRPVEKEHGEAIIAATLKGIAAEPIPGIEQEKSDDPIPSAKFRADALWTAAQAICHAQGIDPMLGTSRQEIGKLAAALTANKTPPPDLRILATWRKSLLADPLAQMLKDTAQLHLRWEAGRPTTA